MATIKNISEFNQKNYREFYSMNEFIQTIGRTLKVITWGSYGWTRMNKSLLRFRVSARRHKGYIYVAVNGSDLFNVWLTNLKGDVKMEFLDVYLEDFIDVIDTEIEYIKEYVY